MQATIFTFSDEDWSLALAYVQAVPAWDATAAYVVNDKVSYGGKIWKAASNNSNVAPNTDATWTLDSAPPVDLTGSTLIMEARAPAGDAYAPISLTSATAGGGIDITDAVNGAFTVTIPLATLQKMKPGDYAYALINIRADGIHETICRGTLTHADGPAR